VNIEGDLDLEVQHYFFLELHVDQERFSTLSKELSSPGTALDIRVRSDRFRNFYAEWSLSISDGRVIKFLDSERDVENADEIPESYWRTSEFKRELLSNPDRPPVTIHVSRPLQPLPAAYTAEDDEDDCGIDDDKPVSSFQPMPTPAPNPIPALEKISKHLLQGAFWNGLWLALIFAILLIRK